VTFLKRIAGLAVFVVLSVIGGRLARKFIGTPSIADLPLAISMLLWCVFSIYWSIAAKNSAPATKSESRQSRLVHQVLVNVALLLMFVPVPGMVQRYLPAWSVFVPLGLALQVACVILGIWARRNLGEHWSGEITIKEDHRLIRTGPYRWVRHPIYTALLGMYLGTALVSGQMHALLGLAMASAAYWRKIRLEEANLYEAFGPDYAAYRRESWALVPGLF